MIEMKITKEVGQPDEILTAEDLKHIERAVRYATPRVNRIFASNFSLEEKASRSGDVVLRAYKRYVRGEK